MERLCNDKTVDSIILANNSDPDLGSRRSNRDSSSSIRILNIFVIAANDDNIALERHIRTEISSKSGRLLKC